MKLLRSLAEELLKPDADLPSLLRQARLISAVLGVSELDSWAKNELEGYSSESPVPEYRKVQTLLRATFFVPLRGFVEWHLPAYYFLPNEKDEELDRMIKEELSSESIELRNPVAELQRWIDASREEGFVGLALPGVPLEWVQGHLQRLGRLGPGVQIQILRRELALAAVEGLLNNVRNRLLELVLALREFDPDLFQDLDITSQPLGDENLRNAVNTIIWGGQNIVGVTQVQQRSEITIRAGELESLLLSLEELGFASDELEELKHVLENGQDGTLAKLLSWLRKPLERVGEAALLKGLDLLLQYLGAR